jgi:hypothetical protein
MASMNVGQALLTEGEVSKQLRVSLAALRKWRVLTEAPSFSRSGPWSVIARTTLTIGSRRFRSGVASTIGTPTLMDMCGVRRLELQTQNWKALLKPMVSQLANDLDMGFQTPMLRTSLRPSPEAKQHAHCGKRQSIGRSIR